MFLICFDLIRFLPIQYIPIWWDRGSVRTSLFGYVSRVHIFLVFGVLPIFLSVFCNIVGWAWFWYEGLYTLVLSSRFSHFSIFSAHSFQVGRVGKGMIASQCERLEWLSPAREAMVGSAAVTNGNCERCRLEYGRRECTGKYDAFEQNFVVILCLLLGAALNYQTDIPSVGIRGDITHTTGEEARCKHCH